MVRDLVGLPAWEDSRLCMVCDDEVPDEYFFTHVDHWKELCRKKFGDE